MPNLNQLNFVGTAIAWSADSDSEPGITHIILWLPDDQTAMCSCRGFQYNKKCWHVNVLDKDADS